MAEARFKFERLDVWKMALNYHDLIYKLAEQLPRSEEFNLKSQITRAATSIALNIAEGSTSQSDPEQARFLGLAIRSLIETVACLRSIERRSYLTPPGANEEVEKQAEQLLARLQAFRNAIHPYQLREATELYGDNG